MQRHRLGRTGLDVSALSFGASALGGVFGEVDEVDGIAAVHAALDAGINHFDVAPAYGATRAEAVLGRALRGIARERYVLSTKVGKASAPGGYGRDTLDYSRAGIRASLDASAARLGSRYLDIVYLHDIEYLGRRDTEQALTEGLAALHELQRDGRIGAVGFGFYPVDLWQRVLRDCEFDAALVHNHLCLNDTRLLGLLPQAGARGVGVVNASPFASGLLTDRGAAAWHPADSADRAAFARAAALCRSAGSSIAQLALQFSCHRAAHAGVATTLFSAASAAAVRQCVAWFGAAPDEALVEAVRGVLAPVIDKDWF